MESTASNITKLQEFVNDSLVLCDILNEQLRDAMELTEGDARHLDALLLEFETVEHAILAHPQLRVRLTLRDETCAGGLAMRWVPEEGLPEGGRFTHR